MGAAVAAVTFDVRIPHSHSLKDKRAAIRPILDGARSRFRVAAAEVGSQALWQRASLAMAAVAETPGHVSHVLDEIERFVWSFPEVEVVECRREWMDTEEGGAEGASGFAGAPQHDWLAEKLRFEGEMKEGGAKGASGFAGAPQHDWLAEKLRFEGEMK